MADVALRDLCKRYAGGALAVDRVTLDARSGEFLALVGPSGCGKSTTLRMIAGLEEISSGSIEIAGRCVNHVPPKDRDIAMVFQNYALYPHMTVYDNMGFALKLRGVSRPEIARRVRAAAEILGLEDLLRRLPRQLSGGQRQRVAVGRAIVRQPKVFLFDEPLSNLDAKMRVEMRGEISRLHRRLGATMIYVTHDQSEAMTMGDRIVVMDQGRIQQADRPLDVYRRPSNLFVARFIGTPPMNLLSGRIVGGASGCRFEWAGGGLDLPAAAGRALAGQSGRDLVLGFRPEALGRGAGEARLRGLVDVIEPMGFETLVQLALVDGARVMARVDADWEVEAGAQLELALRLDEARYFDARTGEALKMDAERS